MRIKEYIDKIPQNLYVCAYEKKPKTIEIGEFDVPLPVKPPIEQFKNYGLPKEAQFFRREQIPSDLRQWEKTYQNKFVSAMYHKRKNGEWWLINGKEIYLTGRAWMFFNFWHIEAGGLPKFRYEAVLFFLFFEMCWNDPNCYGMLDFKARRLGDTEKALFLGWETVTRYRNTRFGMQNKKNDDAETNFKRVVKANKNMIWFFKPISGGLDTPKKELVFEYPTDFVTTKRMKEEKKSKADSQPVNQIAALESTIDYEPTTLGAYDGQRLTIYHGDEWGKTVNMNVKNQWGIVKPTLALNNGDKIIGKCLVTTTVEEFDEGNISTIEVMQQIWNESDPAKRDGNGRTISGLYRLFRSALHGAEIDAYGFTNDDNTRARLKNTEKILTESGALDDLANWRRKHPLHINDVFSVAPKECPLYPAKLEIRIRQIKENLNCKNKPINEDGTEVVPKGVFGDLVWESQFGGNVKWQPNPKGKWCISQHPKNPNVRIIDEWVKPKPANDAFFTFGADPYDARNTTTSKRSDGAGVVYRRLDLDIDGHLVDSAQDFHISESQTYLMQTDQFVCDYVARQDDPEDYYEDMLKTAIYYSVSMLCEKDKPSIENFFIKRGFSRYLKNRPDETKATYKKKRDAKETGIKASVPIINLYVDALKIHVFHRIINSHHPRLLADFRQFTVKNRTEHDLTVAAGMALLSNLDERSKAKIESLQQWGLPFEQKY
jgi:hypothetical protein